MLEQKVNAFVREMRLFGKTDKVLVALSGGADSVALLRVLLHLGYRCEAAHCNFHLRGEESMRDEAFVVSLTEKLGVRLYRTDFDTEAYAAAKGISIEMAARDLRYEWFGNLREEIGAEVIAVAHHRNDSVETLLLNLVRGTGINGLRGIRAVNGRVVRPLLCVDRNEILSYLERLGQNFVTDSTNLQDNFTRNKIRHQVIPVLETINPSAVEAMADTAARLSEVAEIYGKAMEAAVARVVTNGISLDAEALWHETAPKSVLHEVLYPLGTNVSQQRDIYRCLRSGESGKVFYTATHMLLVDHGRLCWKPKETVERKPVLKWELVEVDDSFVVPKDIAVACLDADKINGALTLRRWRSGDRFVPFGMTGFKSVRNYLRDRKQSLFDKERQLVVCSGDDIVWVVEERTDNRFRVTSETRKVLRIWVEYS